MNRDRSSGLTRGGKRSFAGPEFPRTRDSLGLLEQPQPPAGAVPDMIHRAPTDIAVLVVAFASAGSIAKNSFAPFSLAHSQPSPRYPSRAAG
jgi:hypothetical protein